MENINQISESITPNEKIKSFDKRLFMGGLADKSKQEKSFLDLKHNLLDLNILEEDNELIGYEEISNWKPSGESYWAVANIKYRTKDKIEEKKVTVKAITSGFGEEALNANTDARVRRMEMLKRMKINVPEFYSTKKATIYREYIPDNKDEILRKILNNEIDINEQKKIVDRLAYIAAALDKNGFATLKFISDLVYDGNNFYYIDFGFDLGEPNEKQCDKAKKTLDEYFKSTRLGAYIDNRYEYHFEKAKTLNKNNEKLHN